MYDKPKRIRHYFSSHDFGAGAFAGSLKGPAGHKGRIADIGLSHITETFTNTTLPAYIRLGTSGDADKYAEFDCATAAATNTRVASQDDTDAFKNDDGTYAATTEQAVLPPDTQIEVTGTAPTGGTPAGIAEFFVDIDWYK
jgi:hypothetical protein